MNKLVCLTPFRQFFVLLSQSDIEHGTMTSSRRFERCYSHTTNRMIQSNAHRERFVRAGSFRLTAALPFTLTSSSTTLSRNPSKNTLLSNISTISSSLIVPSHYSLNRQNGVRKMLQAEQDNARHPRRQKEE